MEKGRFHAENPQKSHIERLTSAVALVNNHPASPRSIETYSWPGKRMKISSHDSNETFVRLVEKVAEFKVASTPTRAKNVLAHCVQLGRRLDDLLPGDDEGVRFFVKGLNYLEIANPEMAEDIGRILEKVYDEKRFQE